MGNAIKIGRTLTHGDADMENVIEELKTNMQNEISTGSGVPDRNTTGHIYIQLGATSTDALKLYWKDNDGNWNGG